MIKAFRLALAADAVRVACIYLYAPRNSVSTGKRHTVAARALLRYPDGG